MNNVPKY